MFAFRRRAAASQQYAIIVGMIAVVAVLAITAIGVQAKNLFSGVASVTNAATFGNGQNSATSGTTGPLVFAGANLSAPVIVPFSQTLTASDPAGGTITYSGATGSLPPGITWNAASHLLSGTPYKQGTYNFSITANSTANASVTANFSMTITPYSSVIYNNAANGITGYSMTIPSGVTSFNASLSVTNFVGGQKCGIIQINADNVTYGITASELNSEESSSVKNDVYVWAKNLGDSTPLTTNIAASDFTGTLVLSGGTMTATATRVSPARSVTITSPMSAPFTFTMNYERRLYMPSPNNATNCSAQVTLSMN